ncbi:MAG: MarR family winged helix-turn-helix transcriptional regulator [Clostridia bacterium]
MEQRFEIFTLLITKIRRSITKIKTEEMAEFDLKSPHVSCLYYLYQSDGNMTAKEICDASDEDKAAISRSIEYLETNGYIECKCKTEKRYKSPLYLTEKGKLVAEKIAEKVENIVNIASADMNIEERKKFYKNLTTISNNLQKICDEYEG